MSTRVASVRTKETIMADSSNSSGVVAILAIFVMVVLVGFLAVRSGVIGEGTGSKDIDVKVENPVKNAE
jgi:hypothetical protein